MSKAESDIKNIENNFKFSDEEIPIDTVCFHCQQAVEKYLKAYLVSKEISFPYTHNIGSLVQLAEKIDSNFSEIKEQAEILSPFAVEIRYPDLGDLPTTEECKDFYKIALSIKEFILNKF
ncbi:MAG: HEPN domain-containing protein [Leptospiraceae bacterium]|nr:HEPN domain-containing protein [Leptospiraceae bacterium]